MELLWPGFLYLLGLIPILIIAYIWILRRRKPFAVRYSSLSLVRAALPQQSHWRRHVPFALFLLAMSSLIMAVGRPVSTVMSPLQMRPSSLPSMFREACAQRIFCPAVLKLPKMPHCNLFRIRMERHRSALSPLLVLRCLIQPPTTDQELLETAIKNLSTARRTAIGEGILMSLDTIAEIDDSITSPYSGIEQIPLTGGEYIPAIIVLLTDGVSTTGTHPLECRATTVDRGVRVYTIGFGTDHNTSIPNCGFQGGDQFGGGGAAAADFAGRSMRKPSSRCQI